MLNYVRAELYKASRRRVLYVMVGLLLAGECLFCLGWVFGWPDGKFEDMVALLTSTMILGMYLVIPLTWLTAPDTRRGDTLKNEVSYGLSRPMIYMGKMCAALTVCLLTCGIVFAFYLGSNWVALHPWRPLRQSGRCWPSWGMWSCAPSRCGWACWGCVCWPSRFCAAR